MDFKTTLAELKETLKKGLTDSNLDLFTQIDKGLDSLSEEHSKVEKDLSDTKDKLIEVVKQTSFKAEESEHDRSNDTDTPMDLDEALNLAIQEELNKEVN